MCKVKEGAAVESQADLQNLVTSVILRQTIAFSPAEICEKIRTKLSGSSYEDSQDVEERCSDTISTLYTIQCLRSVGPDKYKLAMAFPPVLKR